MIFEQRVPVLVNEDTIYRREDHNKRLLLYGRPLLPGQPFNRLYTPRPPPSLYYDTFVGVYPKIEAFGQTAGAAVPTGPAQPFFLRYQSPPPSLFFDTFVSVYGKQEAVWQVATTANSPPQPNFLLFYRNRPKPEVFEDHSLDTGQTNHPYPHVIQIGIGLFPYTFETPDLCMPIWEEWVPLHPAVNMYPFRQIYPVLPPQQIMLQMFYKAPNWQVEAEPIWRVPDQQTLTQFRWQIVIPTLPNVVGLTQAAAQALLNFDGFNNIIVIFVPSLIVPAGVVAAQIPLPGPVAGFNIPVEIFVSIGFQPAGTVIMPDVRGVILREAIQFLQDAGVYVPANIGYFGTDPITVKWLPRAPGRRNAAYIGDFGIVHAQSPAPGVAVKPNSPVTLTVSSYPDAVSFQ
jgi:PASTA domain